jgi:hypothetical protein
MGVTRSSGARRQRGRPEAPNVHSLKVDRLGEILEVMYTATRRSKTVHATLREWWDEERLRGALRRDGLLAEPRRFPPEEDIPSREGSWRDRVRIVEKRTELWAQLPARLRWESEVVFDEQHTLANRGAKDGEHWWMTSPEGRIESNEGRPGRNVLSVGFEHMLDPARLLGSLELEPREHAQWHGREAIRLRGVPRPGVSPDTALHELGWPSDDYELLLDLERGVLLRSVSRIGEDEVKLHEVLDIAFDEEIPEETFLPPSSV